MPLPPLHAFQECIQFLYSPWCLSLPLGSGAGSTPLHIHHILLLCMLRLCGMLELSQALLALELTRHLEV